jgi:hypothetical protein
MARKIMIGVLFMLMLFALMGCSTETPSIEDSQVRIEATEDNAEEVVEEVASEQETTETTNEVATEETAQEGETAWPVGKMGNLPVPECQVVSVFEYDAISMSGELIIVNYKGMSKAFAVHYTVMLAELGFVDGVSINSDGKILFSGTSHDASGVNFDFDEKTLGGNISYQPVPR